jgi:hypothetical protein
LLLGQSFGVRVCCGCLSRPSGSQHLCQAKIEEFGTRLGQYDIAGFQIAVHYRVAVRIRQSVSHLNGVTQDLIKTQRAFLEPVG